MVVADGQRIGVTEGPLGRFRSGPHPHAGRMTSWPAAPAPSVPRAGGGRKSFQGFRARRAASSVRIRPGSTLARWNSQDGMARQACADGGTRMTAGAGPGAGVPNRVTSSRQDRNASTPWTRCSSTAGDERLEHPAGASDPQVPGPLSRTLHRRVGGLEVGGVVVGPEQGGQVRQELLGTLVPTPGTRRCRAPYERSGRSPVRWTAGWCARSLRRRRSGSTGRPDRDALRREGVPRADGSGEGERPLRHQVAQGRPVIRSASTATGEVSERPPASCRSASL